jgi:hypothetical protein
MRGSRYYQVSDKNAHIAELSQSQFPSEFPI